MITKDFYYEPPSQAGFFRSNKPKGAEVIKNVKPYRYLYQFSNGHEMVEYIRSMTREELLNEAIDTFSKQDKLPVNQVTNRIRNAKGETIAIAYEPIVEKAKKLPKFLMKYKIMP